MKGKKYYILATGFTLLFLAAGSMTALAGSWSQSDGRWRCTADDGSPVASQWFKDPADGIWYYFNGDGFMEANTFTPDGYYVGPDGAWIEGVFKEPGDADGLRGYSESRSPEGNDGILTGNPNSGNDGSPAEGSGPGNDGFPAEGSGPGNDGFPAEGSGLGNDGSPAESSAPGSTDGHAVSTAGEIVGLVNNIRSGMGRRSLTVNESLMKAAAVRGEEIVEQFSHTRPGGTASYTVLDDAGIDFLIAGENIAYGQETPEEVVNAWMESESHRENILNSEYTEIGVDCYVHDGVRYWVQIFRFN